MACDFLMEWEQADDWCPKPADWPRYVAEVLHHFCLCPVASERFTEHFAIVPCRQASLQSVRLTDWKPAYGGPLATMAWRSLPNTRS